MLMFDGVECIENEINDICKKPSEFHVILDLRDVMDLKKVKLGGPLPDNFDLLALYLSYSHDYYLSFSVSTVSGSIPHRNKGRVATVYFKVKTGYISFLIVIPKASL